MLFSALSSRLFSSSDLPRPPYLQAPAVHLLQPLRSAIPLHCIGRFLTMTEVRRYSAISNSSQKDMIFRLPTIRQNVRTHLSSELAAPELQIPSARVEIPNSLTHGRQPHGRQQGKMMPSERNNKYHILMKTDRGHLLTSTRFRC